MAKVPWLLVLSLLIATAITQASLWIRNIRPSKRISLWEHLLWEMPPRDEQTKEYYKQRLLTAIIVLPVTVLALYAFAELYKQ
ncbi:hypothetical protein [Bradyrhizobium sp. AUGA SZCCT0182]|uniref:hypothetical protein n=1 Tax=Bradyrhizobium sp. AUGA SZCCT0182 TaxID=2807667 RepID=UPI001BA4BFAB|nr:hypothetical protein [Bradyrhizobium sp. AUGA SZCCT0182]MBR1236458.1 hypothetical protein [Bradyrhizobium sp. AUGA SZCCT0182]